MFLLFTLGLIAIPFNDFFGLSFLGELKHELSFYLFMLALAMMGLAAFCRRGAVAPPYLLTRIMLPALAVIAISFLMNFQTISESSFRDRWAVEKFMTSSLVVLYGFALAVLAYAAGRKKEWKNLIAFPIGVSVILSALVVGLEMLGWFSEGIRSFFQPLMNIVHSGAYYVFGRGDVTGILRWSQLEGRARGVCFEPPALATFAGFALPWLYYGWRVNVGGRRAFYLIAWLLCLALLGAAFSRTSLVFLAGYALAGLALRFVFLPPRLQRMRFDSLFVTIMSMGLIAALTVVVFHADNVAAMVMAGDNVSTLSRYASITAAFRMFLDSPLWGLGFGQYGFHVAEYMPSWGYASWEVRAWLANPHVTWPPVFSIYARLAAETGLMGLLGWIGVWVGMISTLIRSTLAYQRATGTLLPQSYPLVMGCCGVLMAGAVMDSLRTPMIWITLGLSCGYLLEVRTKLAFGRPRTVA